MLPYQNLISLSRKSDNPIYLQIVNQLIKLIQNGQLQPGSKLPGSRVFANILGTHRNTVVKALDELEALGWIEIKANVGAHVVESFPIIRPSSWQKKENQSINHSNTKFNFYNFPHLGPPGTFQHTLSFDDGIPDIRLAPIDELAKAYARNTRKLGANKLLSYQDGLGNINLRLQLAKLLNETRGLNITEENIIITRGTIMAIHLATAVSLKPGDKIIIGETNYQTANMVFTHFGGKLCRVPVDAEGIDVQAVETLCKQSKVRALYVTSHHHHPTTVTLSPERRIQLLKLSEQYGFVILEDDYDYDFHYDNNPILPLASGDRNGQVLYLGSFTKLIAPAFRVGYLVGPRSLIKRLPHLTPNPRPPRRYDPGAIHC